VLSKALEAVGVGVGGREAVHLAGLECIRGCGGMDSRGRYLLAAARSARLDAVAALDDIGLEGDGPGAAVQLEEEAAGIAEHGAGLVAAPERRGARGAVLADGLEDEVSQGQSGSGQGRLLSIADCDKGLAARWPRPGRDTAVAQRGQESIPESWSVRPRSRARQLRKSCCGHARVCCCRQRDVEKFERASAKTR